MNNSWRVFVEPQRLLRFSRLKKIITQPYNHHLLTIIIGGPANKIKTFINVLFSKYKEGK